LKKKNYFYIKNNFLKYKKNYFNIFLNKNTLKKQQIQNHLALPFSWNDKRKSYNFDQKFSYHHTRSNKTEI
jgi:hypothetical protein